MKTHVGYNVFVRWHVSRWLTYLSVNFPATVKPVARRQVHLSCISRFIDMACTFISHLHWVLCLNYRYSALTLAKTNTWHIH